MIEGVGGPGSGARQGETRRPYVKPFVRSLDVVVTEGKKSVANTETSFFADPEGSVMEGPS